MGEPIREEELERARAEELPDLDERERRISVQRKPMGPPFESEEEVEALIDEAQLAPSPEPPTDPADAESSSGA